MSTVSRGVVYSLIAVVVVLLLGITALLGVAYSRHQRLEDTTIDLQRNLAQQENRIMRLQTLLQDCDTLQTTTPSDTSWNTTLTAKPKRFNQTPAGW